MYFGRPRDLAAAAAEPRHGVRKPRHDRREHAFLVTPAPASAGPLAFPFAAHPLLALAKALDLARLDRAALLVVDPFGGVPLGPDLREPESDPELDPELPDWPGIVVVVLVLPHGRRNVEHITGLPVMPLAEHLRVALALERVDDCLEMLVPAAVVVRPLLPDLRDQHARVPEAVAWDREVPDLAVLLRDRGDPALVVERRIGRRVLEVDECPVAARVVLGLLVGERP